MIANTKRGNARKMEHNKQRLSTTVMTWSRTRWRAQHGSLKFKTVLLCDGKGVRAIGASCLPSRAMSTTDVLAVACKYRSRTVCPARLLIVCFWMWRYIRTRSGHMNDIMTTNRTGIAIFQNLRSGAGQYIVGMEIERDVQYIRVVFDGPHRLKVHTLRERA